MAAQQQVEIQVLRELNQNWLECVDAQGLYYFNKISQECLDQMPAEAQAGSMQMMQSPQIAPQQQWIQAQPPQYAQQGAIIPQPQTQPQPVRKMIIGAWSVMEDAQGIFFHNPETGEQVDQVPPEIAGVYAKVSFTNGQMSLPTAQPQQMYQSYQPQAFVQPQQTQLQPQQMSYQPQAFVQPQQAQLLQPQQMSYQPQAFVQPQQAQLQPQQVYQSYQPQAFVQPQQSQQLMHQASPAFAPPQYQQPVQFGQQFQQFPVYPPQQHFQAMA